MPGALDGVRVLEFSEMIAAPFAGMHLGDLGADVIKVEPPEGDPWRHSLSSRPNESRTFLALNRNKRGLALDLKRPEAQAVVHRIVTHMDVVVVDYRPDVPKRLGVDDETLRRLQPRLIYLQNTAMGTRGEHSHRPGYDLIAQGVTGLMLTGGRVDDDGVPMPLTPAVADYGTGLVDRAGGVRGAARARTHRAGPEGGDHPPRHLARAPGVGVPAHRGAEPALGGDRGQLGPDARALNAYYRVYRTADSMISVACLTPALRRRMADAIAVADVRHGAGSNGTPTRDGRRRSGSRGTPWPASPSGRPRNGWPSWATLGCRPARCARWPNSSTIPRCGRTTSWRFDTRWRGPSRWSGR